VTVYRLMDGASGRPGVGSSGTQPPSSVTSTSGGWLLGTIFSVTGQMGWLNGYWHWVPGNGDTTARKFALWNRYSTSAQNLVTDSTVTSGTMTLGAFNYVPLATPIQLAPGALYVAACGWTVTTGIPVSSGQFGSGDPYAAGITNGPLSGWSAISGSNTFPAATVNYNIGQGLFSNALGADPSAAMPNNGSGDDNLWVDVQVSSTAPSGYAGSYRLYPNMADLGNYSLDTANNFTLGMEFSLSQACTVNNVWFYSPATVTQLPTAVGVYQVSGASLVTSNNSPSWSGAAASGWISTPLTGTLAAGPSYKVVVLNGAGSPAIWNAAVANYWSTGFGSAGLTAGPVTAPDNAAADAPGQESYNLGAALTYPGTNAGPYTYGLDIEVTPQAAGPVTGPAYTAFMSSM
jgi:hypothetical protein